MVRIHGYTGIIGGHMDIKYDHEADAVYVQLTERQVASTLIIDDSRFVHYDSAGAVRGVEFLWASDGLRLSDLPFDSRRIATALVDAGIPVVDTISIPIGPQSLKPFASALASGVISLEYDLVSFVQARLDTNSTKTQTASAGTASRSAFYTAGQASTSHQQLLHAQAS